MVRTIGILATVFILSCHEKAEDKPVEIPATGPQSVKIKFRNVREVVEDTTLVHWFDPNTKGIAIYYFGIEKDRLAIQYYPECWGEYPLFVDSNKIKVYWTNELDSKYGFAVVKAIKNYGKKKGSLWMEMTLSSDSTLDVKYFDEEFRRIINESDTTTIFLPSRLVGRLIK